MPFFTDQIGNTIELTSSPRRIVSLVPSQTELLYDLGLQDEVVGITKFCVHPDDWFRNKLRVGGTKDLHIDRIHQLQPDLIIANKEENVKEQVEELSARYPVWVSDVSDLADALKMIHSLGEITNRLAKAGALIKDISENFRKLEPRILQHPGDILSAYLIWRNPYMVAGNNTFIDAMMKLCGLKNVFDDVSRYPLVNIEELKRLNCQLILLSSEPYPFSSKHIEELRPELPGSKFLLIDGAFFSWYGSRLLHAPYYFDNLLQNISHL
jgi:ABC-type Fe3+-hydroxamate transport system substrate-binding protein